MTFIKEDGMVLMGRIVAQNEFVGTESIAALSGCIKERCVSPMTVHYTGLTTE